MSIPPLYENAKFEDVTETIRNYFNRMHDSRRGMYIHGEVGTGKTHIAYALKKEWDATHKNPARFWNVTELLREIRADYDRQAFDKSHVEDRLMEFRGLLFLDDIGAEKVTDWVAETFYLIINHRYVERMPVIFTSNLPVGELAERIGDRTASRIVEMCEIVELQGGDRRINKHSKVTIAV